MPRNLLMWRGNASIEISMTYQRSGIVHFSAALVAPRYWLLWLWFGIVWLVSRLPYAAMQAVGRRLGGLLYRLLSSRRSVALKTLAICLPELSDAEREEMARASFKAFGVTLFESGIVWWTNPEKTTHLFRVTGAKKVQQALDNGERVLLLATHMTCLEIAFSHLATRIPFSVLYRVHDNPVFEYVSARGRAQFEVELMPRKRVADFLDRVRSGKAGLIVPDQDMGAKRSVFVPLFNEQAATITAASDYARATGAQVAVAKCHRTDDNKVAIEIDDFLENFPTEDVVADAARMNQLLEAAIREHPEQYLWAHRRFKTRPEGAAAFY